MSARATRIRRAALVVATLGALAAPAGFAGPAWAAPAQPLNGASESFAGYTLTPSHGVASASATFKVATITCATGGGPGQSFGVWGFDTQAAYVAEAAVQTSCTGTTPTYNFYILANSANFTESGVSPGDTVAASFYQTPGWTQATVHDLTSGITWVANWATTSLPASTVWIGADSIPGNGYVAPFGSVKFTKTQVNGDYLGYQSPSGWNWTNNKTVLVSAHPIIGGDTFTLTFHHSH